LLNGPRRGYLKSSQIVRKSCLLSICTCTANNNKKKLFWGSQSLLKWIVFLWPLKKYSCLSMGSLNKDKDFFHNLICKGIKELLIQRQLHFNWVFFTNSFMSSSSCNFSSLCGHLWQSLCQISFMMPLTICRLDACWDWPLQIGNGRFLMAKTFA